jgi:hypothetical protein
MHPGRDVAINVLDSPFERTLFVAPRAEPAIEPKHGALALCHVACGNEAGQLRLRHGDLLDIHTFGVDGAAAPGDDDLAERLRHRGGALGA